MAQESSKRQLLNDEAVAMFRNLIEKKIGIELLASYLDEAMWEITRYKLTDREFIGNPDESNSIYYIRELRNICQGTYQVNA